MKAKEIEVSLVVPFEDAKKYIEANKASWKKIDIEDYYLTATHRFRFIKDKNTEKVVSVKKSKEEKEGVRIETLVKLDVDNISNFKDSLEQSTRLKIVKNRYQNKKDKNLTLDLVNSPMKIAMFELEFDDVKTYQEKLNEINSRGLKTNILNTWNYFKRRIGVAGPPSSGKTSVAKKLSLLLNINYEGNSSDVVEYATTFIQKTGQIPKLEDQIWLYQKQKEREEAVSRTSNIVISDSPIWIGYTYALRAMRELKASRFTDFTLGSLYKRSIKALGYYQFIALLKPINYIENNVRFHSFEESKEISQELRNFLRSHGYSFHEYTYDDVDKMLLDLLYMNELENVLKVFKL